MHMANELLSVPVAAGTITIAGAGLAYVCRQVRKTVTPERLGLMGILGAFVFAAQMINLPLPGLPGTSAHLIGAVLLSIILGPHAGALVMTSILVVQCFIFQDGGLLALGCNMINMAIIPSYAGYAFYVLLTGGTANRMRIHLAVLVSAFITVELSATLVPLQTALSGVLTVPMKTFLLTMWIVHLVIGLMEGILTVAVLGYLQRLRPDILQITAPVSRKTLLIPLSILTLLIAAGFSLFASNRPDGLEWSYAQLLDQPQPNQTKRESIVQTSAQSETVDAWQDRYALMPDYTRRSAPLGHIPLGQASIEGTAAGAGWTSFAGVVGSLLTMGLIWLTTYTLRKRTMQI